MRVSNGLDPDQDLYCVHPDLDPNCLQRLSAGNKSQKLFCLHMLFLFEESLKE